jgi:hypothetical protein
MPAMHLRRSVTLLTGALLLIAPLGACGFDNATDRVNTIAVGTNDRDASVDVLGAVIVSAEEGSGTFIASFVNNSLEEDATVEAITPQDAEAAQVVDFSPIDVAPNTLVNLALDDQGVAMEGDFAAGGVVPLVVELSGGELVELDVPVVHNCGPYEGLDGVGGECEVAEPEGEH